MGFFVEGYRNIHYKTPACRALDRKWRLRDKMAQRKEQIEKNGIEYTDPILSWLKARKTELMEDGMLYGAEWYSVEWLMDKRKKELENE